MEHAIPDIPRIYTAVAEWLSCGLFVTLLGPKIKRLPLVIFSVLYLALISFFLEITANVLIWLWLPCMLVAFFLVAVFIMLCCRTGLREGIYYATLAFSVAECMASLEWQIANAVFRSVGYTTVPLELLILISIYGLSIFGVWLLLRKRLPKDKPINIESKDLLVGLVILVVMFLFSNLSFMTSDTATAGQYSREIANIRTLVDISGVSILYAHFLTCRNNTVKQELIAVQSTLQNQYKQYQQSRESIDIINMKYHDLKHQINMLRKMTDGDRREEILNSIEAEIKAYELQNKTGNSVLDTLLTGKSMYCSNHGITLTAVADGSLLDFMDAMDICSIFGNALDNAIESVEKIGDKEKRLIHLTVSRVKNFVMIRVQNYFEGDIKSHEGNILTTKKDKNLHGYGIKSIKYTVNRYDGVVNIQTENRWFELKILIPYNK